MALGGFPVVCSTKERKRKRACGQKLKEKGGRTCKKTREIGSSRIRPRQNSWYERMCVKLQNKKACSTIRGGDVEGSTLGCDRPHRLKTGVRKEPPIRMIRSRANGRLTTRRITSGY